MSDEYITQSDDLIFPASPGLGEILQKYGGSMPADGGGDDPYDLKRGRITLRIGRRPYAIPLTSISRASGQQASDEYADVLSAYEYWAILYSIGIQDTGDWRNIIRFGLTVRLQESTDARVASVFPETQMLSLGGGDAKWEGALGVSGALVPSPVSSNPGLNSALQTLAAQIAAAGANARFDVGANLVMGLSFNVLSPVIVSTGVNDIQSSWTFTQTPDKLLHGDQVVGHVIALRKPAVGYLRLEAQLFTDLGLLYVFTRRYKGAPVLLDIKID